MGGGLRGVGEWEAGGWVGGRWVGGWVEASAPTRACARAYTTVPCVGGRAIRPLPATADLGCPGPRGCGEGCAGRRHTGLVRPRFISSRRRTHMKKW